MNLLAALVMLSSASDDFTTLSPEWRAGIRGRPQTELVTIDGESCLSLRATSAEPTPGVDDLVRNFPRPVLASEHPFAQFSIYVPSFPSWPIGPSTSGSFNYCGGRLTITRTQGGFVWPGVFLGRHLEQPAFIVRVLGDSFGRYITQEGWWTVSIGTRQSPPVLAFYAAPGKVALTEADCFFTDPDPFTTVASFDGWFLQVATPTPWFVGSVRMYADVPPLTISRAGGAVALTAGYPGMVIERSTDLVAWLPCANPDLITQPNQFYRAR